MISIEFTKYDCHREVWLEVEILLAQRKISRLLKSIAFKEEIAQGVTSPWFCAHYDRQVEMRYGDVAVLEGGVRAAKLELDRLADKRYADQACRMAMLMQVAPPAVSPHTAQTTSPTPSLDPRQNQQAMIFGPGAPPAASPKPAPPSETIDQKAEDDIACAFEICAREIPPPDLAATTATPPPTTPTSSGEPATAVAPLTHSTLSRLVKPAADTPSASVHREEDTSTVDALQADPCPEEDSASAAAPAAGSDSLASTAAHAGTETPGSVAAPDSRSALQHRAAEPPSADSVDGNERTDRNDSDGVK